MPWLAIFMGIASFGISAWGAQQKKSGGYLQADEFDNAADDVVTAHKFNVAERTKVYNFNLGQKVKSTKKNIGKARRKGAYDRALTIAEGEKILGRQTVRASTSGATAGEGTPLNVRIMQVSNNLFQERMVEFGTAESIDLLKSEFVDWSTAQKFEFDSWKRSADFQSDAQYKQYKRKAKLTRQQADLGYFSDMASGLGGSIGTFSNFYSPRSSTRKNRFTNSAQNYAAGVEGKTPW